MKYESRIGQLYRVKKLSDEEFKDIDILKLQILRLKLLKTDIIEFLTKLIQWNFFVE